MTNSARSPFAPLFLAIAAITAFAPGCANERDYRKPTTDAMLASGASFPQTHRCAVAIGQVLSLEESRGCADGVAEQWIAFQNSRWNRQGDSRSLEDFNVVIERLADPRDGSAVAWFSYQLRPDSPAQSGAVGDDHFAVHVDRNSGVIRFFAGR